MKKTKLIVLFLLIHFFSNGQAKNEILGKWKLITFEAVVFHDYRNDSTYFPPDYLETLKGSNDSSFMIGFLHGMIKSFDKYYYEFEDSNEYREIKNDKTKEQGTFEVNPKDKLIILLTKDNFGRETKQTLLYELSDKVLSLKIPNDDFDLKMQLIKMQ